MQARTLPAIRGWNWMTEGFALFRSNPAALCFFVFGYLVILLLVSGVPFLGVIAGALCMPALSVGVMNACRALDQRTELTAELVFSGFQQNVSILLTLGGLYFVAKVVVVAMSALVDGGLLAAAMIKEQGVPEEVLQDESFLLAVQFVAVCLLPIAMAFWFAPLLAAWQNIGAVKSLFFSFVACWRNWRAFLVYGLGIGGIAILLPACVLGIAAGVSQWWVQMLTVAVSMPLFFVFIPTLFASFYISYRDIFVPEGTYATQH